MTQLSLFKAAHVNAMIQGIVTAHQSYGWDAEIVGAEVFLRHPEQGAKRYSHFECDNPNRPTLNVTHNGEHLSTLFLLDHGTEGVEAFQAEIIEAMQDEIEGDLENIS